jgi:hypothetical protein
MDNYVEFFRLYMLPENEIIKPAFNTITNFKY